MSISLALAKLIRGDFYDTNNSLIDVLLDDSMISRVIEVSVDNDLPYFTQSNVINLKIRITMK